MKDFDKILQVWSDYILHRGPERLSLRQNWVPQVPTPFPASECVSPLDPKGGKQHSLAGEGLGRTQFGRMERKPDTLYTLWL